MHGSHWSSIPFAATLALVACTADPAPDGSEARPKGEVAVSHDQAVLDCLNANEAAGASLSAMATLQQCLADANDGALERIEANLSEHDSEHAGEAGNIIMGLRGANTAACAMAWLPGAAQNGSGADFEYQICEVDGERRLANLIDGYVDFGPSRDRLLLIDDMEDHRECIEPLYLDTTAIETQAQQSPQDEAAERVLVLRTAARCVESDVQSKALALMSRGGPEAPARAVLSEEILSGAISMNGEACSALADASAAAPENRESFQLDCWRHGLQGLYDMLGADQVEDSFQAIIEHLEGGALPAIHPELGIWVLSMDGIFRTVEHRDSFDAARLELGVEGVLRTTCTVDGGAVQFDRDRGYDRQGCFVSPALVRGELSDTPISYALNEVVIAGQMQVDDATLVAAAASDQHVEHKVVITDEEAVLYYGRVDGQPYLLAVDLAPNGNF